MEVSKIWRVLWYLGLLGCGLWVAQKSLKEYISGGIGHTTSKELITESDLPIILTCLVFTKLMNKNGTVIEYGKDFHIDAKVLGIDGVVQLIDDGYTDGLIDLELHLSKMYQTYLIEKEHMEAEEQWECYKILPKWIGIDKIDFEEFGLQLMFNTSRLPSMPNKIHIVITSEDDSYGIVDGKWSNGNVLFPSTILQSFGGCYYHWCKGGGTGQQRRLKIELSESTNIWDSTCSQDPYYECLANRFSKLDILEYSDVMVNGSKCKFGQKCSPFSMPLGGKAIPLPLCINQNARICYESVISRLENDPKEDCKKSCHIKKYKVKDETYHINHSYDYGIEYFLVAPYATKDIRFQMPFKKTEREYLILSIRLLVGNVGGTLSLFVGFSFISSTESFLALGTSMTPKKILTSITQERYQALVAAKNLVLFIGFLTGAIAFVYQSVVEYMTENTTFIETLKPISLQDLPTVTLCLAITVTGCGVWLHCESPLVYGKDFSILVKINAQKEYNLTLEENKYLPALYGLDIHLSEIVQKRKIQEEHYKESERRQCYKISSRETVRNEKISMEDFNLQVFIHSYGKFSRVDVIFSSEKNSYGIVNQRWFDGVVNFPLFSLNPVASHNDYRKERIVEVTDYKSISSACSNDSYYECLGKRYAAFDFNSIGDKTVNGSSCSSNTICSPFSLPNLGQIPVCTDVIGKICYEHVISELEKSQQEYCKKSCSVTEYKVEIETDKTNKIRWPETNYSSTVGFDYNFKQSTAKVRSKNPSKVVKTEYFITPLILLIGSSGGTIGLFVGISFVTVFEWLCSKVVPWTKKEHSRHEFFSRVSLKVLLYFGLGFGAIFFIRKSIIDYRKGDTAYSTISKPISLDDLPTLTLCFNSKYGKMPLQYGQTLTIDVSVSEKQEQSFTLIENNYSETLFGIKFYLGKLMQTLQREQVHRKQGLIWQCYRVVPHWMGKDEANIQELKIRFTFNITTVSWPEEVVIVATSEENSYGIVSEKWYDGHTVFPTSIIYPNPWFSGYNTLNIVGINEYQHLETICSPDSYYQCLARRLERYDFSQSQQTYSFKRSKCSYDSLCYPFSLPPNDGNMIPICQNDSDRSCYDGIVADLEENQEEHCKQYCHVKEFMTVEGEFLREEKNVIGLQYQFAPYNWNNTGEVFKTVKKEYYVMSVLTLIGNVGGTLGMFTGFSFLGASEWFVMFVEKSWTWSRTNFAGR